MKYRSILPAVLTGTFLFAVAQFSSAAQVSDVDLQRNRRQGDQRDQHGTSQRQELDHQPSTNELSARHFIEDFDEHGDGALTRDELPRRIRDQVRRLDRNGDGRLTAEELRHHGNRAAARRRAGPDEVVYIWVTDADSGHLSLNDLQQAYASLQEIDDNGNGDISREELGQRRQELFVRWAGRVTERLDDSGDGRISSREAQDTFLETHFDRLDNNRDGAISQRELSQCIASGMHRSGQEMRTGSREESQSDRARQQRSGLERSL
jgi:Ca2+-binding EF-hand superfamily protein